METRYLYTKKKEKYYRQFLAIILVDTIRGINTSKTSHFIELHKVFFYIPDGKGNGTEGIKNHAPHSIYRIKCVELFQRESKACSIIRVCVFFCECAQKELNA